MKQRTIKADKEKVEQTYRILSEYLKEKADLKNALEAGLEHKHMIDYCVDKGAKDSGIITGMYKLLVKNCIDIVENREHPKVLKGDKCLKDNGYKDNLLDEFY